MPPDVAFWSHVCDLFLYFMFFVFFLTRRLNILVKLVDFSSSFLISESVEEAATRQQLEN